MSRGAGQDATSRAAAAARRVHEVEERLRDLRAGKPSTPEDVQRAEQAAGLERELSAGAHHRAAQAHWESAKSHRQASDVLRAAGHSEQAAEHLRKAELDEAAAQSDDATALPDLAGEPTP